MSKSTELGLEAAKEFVDLTGSAQAALDPATIMTFAELIMQFIAKFKECKQTPTSAQQTMKNPGFFQKLILRREVKNATGNAGFRQHGEQIISALSKVGSKLKVEDVVALYNEDD